MLIRFFYKYKEDWTGDFLSSFQIGTLDEIKLALQINHHWNFK